MDINRHTSEHYNTTHPTEEPLPSQTACENKPQPPDVLTPAAPWSPWRSRIMIVGLFCMFLALLFPPWHFWVNTASVRKSEPAPRSFVLDPPSAPSSSRAASVGIDFRRLSVEIALIAVAVGMALALRARAR